MIHWLIHLLYSILIHWLIMEKSRGQKVWGVCFFGQSHWLSPSHHWFKKNVQKSLIFDYHPCFIDFHWLYHHPSPPNDSSPCSFRSLMLHPSSAFEWWRAAQRKMGCAHGRRVQGRSKSVEDQKWGVSINGGTPKAGWFMWIMAGGTPIFGPCFANYDWTVRFRPAWSRTMIFLAQEWRCDTKDDNVIA